MISNPFLHLLTINIFYIMIIIFLDPKYFAGFWEQESKYNTSFI